MPTPIYVQLTDEQCRLADREGKARNDAATSRHARSNGPQGDFVRQNIIGVRGEIAFATWSGLPWVASRGADYDDTTADVGNCEVRTRRVNSDGNMTVKVSAFDKYEPSRVYVLAWAHERSPIVRLIGYTSLGDIFEYGTLNPKWNAMVLPWQQLADLRSLNAREPQHR